MSGKVKIMALESPSYAVSEDAMARFKHQGLLLDFQHLHKETEAAKKKLKKLNQKKLTLFAEVRFLRHRYKVLMKNKIPKCPPIHRAVQLQCLGTQPKSIMKHKNYTRRQAALGHGVPHTALNQKRRNHSGNDTYPVFDGGKEAVAPPNPKPVFDLNRVSGEEDEFRASSEAMVRFGSGDVEQHLDMRLSGCRDASSSSSRAGKRKISWQDQVSLRV